MIGEGTEQRRDGSFEVHRDAGRYALVGACLDTALPVTATLLSYYDPGIEKWRQLWVESQGSVVQFTEKSAGPDGGLVLEGTWIHPNGDQNPARLSYTVQGEWAVKLQMHVSPDAGRTWRTVIDTKLKKLADEPPATGNLPPP